ncbi:MAG: hypothetical protein PHI73_01830 [Patescibacteria group bacterium]|nr:hypothetical protein [Patescibacteria group bacterium]
MLQPVELRKLAKEGPVVASTGLERLPEVKSLLGMVCIADVDRSSVLAVMVREGSGEPDILDPTPEPPAGVNPERWRKMELGQPIADEAAVIVLGDSPGDDVLISATYPVIHDGACSMLPSVTVVCPFKPRVFRRFPGYGRGRFAERHA